MLDKRLGELFELGVGTGWNYVEFDALRTHWEVVGDLADG